VLQRRQFVSLFPSPEKTPLTIPFLHTVIFSVLVLHWVTSKDSSTTTSSYTHSTTNNRNPRSTVLGTLSGKEEGARSGATVTTHISAVTDMGKDLGEDVEMGKIRVRVGQVVETEGGSDAGSLEGLEVKEEGRRSHWSTEDLVSKGEM
jgi:hypothetical protein